MGYEDSLCSKKTKPLDGLGLAQDVPFIGGNVDKYVIKIHMSYINCIKICRSGEFGKLNLKNLFETTES